MSFFSVVLACLCLLWLYLFMRHGARLVRLWREPALACPVLVIESDDWGYGPPQQVQALRQIAAVLGRHCDRLGRPPVMTLGLVLAGPDGRDRQMQRLQRYIPLTLADAEFDALREVMEDGRRAGVFSLQLHGGEHFHPEVLLCAARREPELARWCASWPAPATEALPSALQSRWADCMQLPSRPLPDDDVVRRASAEVSLYRQLFAQASAVVVPPTFVWTDTVEQAWRAAGMDTVVTPGRRYPGRGADGLPYDQPGVHFFNGARTRSGMTAMVRDDYFEPFRGHEAGQGVDAHERKWAQRRPTLLETHRCNFIGDPALAARALVQIDAMLAQVLLREPQTRFVSVAELAEQYRNGGDLIATGLRARLLACMARLRPQRRLCLALLALIASSLALGLAFVGANVR